MPRKIRRRRIRRPIRYRSAITGHYVSESYAKRHPKTTVRET
jgi:hypothetical protein